MTRAAMTYHDAKIAAIIEDIKSIVAVLDPEGAKWAQEAKKERLAMEQKYRGIRFYCQKCGAMYAYRCKCETCGVPVVSITEMKIRHTANVVRMVNEAMGVHVEPITRRCVKVQQEMEDR